MTKYLCDKHGFIEANRRLMWNVSSVDGEKKWCLKCFNEMMDTHCGPLTLVEDNPSEDVPPTIW